MFWILAAWRKKVSSKIPKEGGNVLLLDQDALKKLYGSTLSCRLNFLADTVRYLTKEDTLSFIPVPSRTTRTTTTSSCAPVSDSSSSKRQRKKRKLG